MLLKGTHRNPVCANLPLLSASDGTSSFEYIALKDLVLISAVSPSMRALVGQFIRGKWLRALSRFVDSPVELCNLLRSTHSVVSGSTALHFILDSPRSWTASDCDLYVPFGASDTIQKYLRGRESYEDPRGRSGKPDDYVKAIQNSRHNPSIHSVVHLYRSNGMKIDIIESTSTSALHPLAFFWSTHVTNYISADTLCVTYPSLTFNGRGCYVPITHAAVDRALAKYEARGFRLTSFSSNVGPEVCSLYPSLLNDCNKNPNCPHQFRSFGDKWCLQFVFDESSTNHDAADVPVPLWRYGGRECGVCGLETDREVRMIDS